MRQSRKRTNEQYPLFFRRVLERDGRECWVAGLPGQSAAACSGPLDAMHLIGKSRIRDERSARRLEFKVGPELPADVEWDPRLGKIGCRFHHQRLDGRALHLPRAWLPPAVEEWADEYGMTWSLARDFGLRSEEEV